MASLGAALKKHREGAGLSQSEVEDQLNLGDQWIQEFEANRVVPTLAYLSRLAECYSVELAVLVGAFSPLSSLGSGLAHQPRGNSTEISFDFGRHRALYRLQDVDHGSFEEYLAAFRAEMSDDDAKADHVATAFRVATEMWPHLNASDIWYFLVSRLFVDSSPGRERADGRLNESSRCTTTRFWRLTRSNSSLMKWEIGSAERLRARSSKPKSI